MTATPAGPDAGSAPDGSVAGTAPDGSVAGSAPDGSVASSNPADRVPRARGGHQLGTGIVTTLIGAGLALTASGQLWAHADVSRWPQVPAGPVQLTGRELAPAAFGLALLALAAVAALVATRGVVRRGVGVLISVSGAAVAVSSFRANLLARDVALAQYPGAAGAVLTRTAWPWLSALGGLVLVGAGAFVAARGGSWPSMSRRYEAVRDDFGPVEAATASPTDLWRALDRGDDPTK